MIRNTLTLCSIASTLLKCIQDTENVYGRRGRLETNKLINTTYGVAVYVSVDMKYGWDDNRSSISIKIDNKSIFKISFKYINDDWKLDAFIDNSDKNTLLLDAVSEALLVKLKINDKNTLLLNVVSEALVNLMMDMVHAMSIHVILP